MPGQAITAPSGKSRSDVIEECDREGILRLRFPEPFNVAEYFIDRHLAEGREKPRCARPIGR